MRNFVKNITAVNKIKFTPIFINFKAQFIPCEKSRTASLKFKIIAMRFCLFSSTYPCNSMKLLKTRLCRLLFLQQSLSNSCILLSLHRRFLEGLWIWRLVGGTPQRRRCRRKMELGKLLWKVHLRVLLTSFRFQCKKTKNSIQVLINFTLNLKIDSNLQLFKLFLLPYQSIKSLKQRSALNEFSFYPVFHFF